MITRYDALTVRESNGKSYFTKLGVAFPAKNGPGFTVLLDAMPAPVEGQYKIILVEPKPRDERGGAEGASARNAPPAYNGGLDDDDVPF